MIASYADCGCVRHVALFSAHFPGHSFGPIPAPGSFAASAFPAPPKRHESPSHKAAVRPFALGAAASRFWVPQEMGQKKEKNEKCMSYQLSDDHRLRRRRPGAASSAEQQRLEVHRSSIQHFSP